MCLMPDRVFTLNPDHPDYEAAMAAVDAYSGELVEWRQLLDETEMVLGRRLVVRDEGTGHDGEVLGPVRDVEPERVGVLPDGWRASRSYRWLVPHLGPHGDEARALLRSVQPPPSIVQRLTRFGLPSRFGGGMDPHTFGVTIHYWRAELHGDDQRLFLITTAEEYNGNDLFRRIANGDYYQILEAEADGQPVEGSDLALLPDQVSDQPVLVTVDPQPAEDVEVPAEVPHDDVEAEAEVEAEVEDSSGTGPDETEPAAMSRYEHWELGDPEPAVHEHWEMAWGGTAEGATPIIEWVLNKGWSANYHDPTEPDGPYLRVGSLDADGNTTEVYVRPGEIVRLDDDGVFRVVADRTVPVDDDAVKADAERVGNDGDESADG